uniref:Uncharacterized protein n=1 Tax=Panagrolaimus sp. PS1159 TaxID=55785 RepID=A0AC35F1X9_9BILA
MKFFAVLFFFVLVVAVTFNGADAGNNIRTPPCDEVCHRSNPEQESCCKAHGFSTGRCKDFQSFCDN